jgi:N6-L-threonylcarbamoyladenine synthase
LAQLAQGGDARAFALPRPLMHSGNLDFSFAGLKTAVLTQSQKLISAAGVRQFPELESQVQRDLAASTQAAIVEVLVHKSVAALRQTGLNRLVVAGGVGANACLRAELDAACAARQVRVYYPELNLCTDNGAMIAMAAAMRLQCGKHSAGANYSFEVKPRWPLADV